MLGRPRAVRSGIDIGNTGQRAEQIEQIDIQANVAARNRAIGGRHCENCQVSDVTEGLISPVSPGVRAYALDPTRAKALWAKSEEMVGERF